MGEAKAPTTAANATKANPGNANAGYHQPPKNNSDAASPAASNNAEIHSRILENTCRILGSPAASPQSCKIRYETFVTNRLIDNFHLPKIAVRTSFYVVIYAMKITPLLLVVFSVVIMATSLPAQSLTQQIAEAEKVAIQNESPEDSAKSIAETLGEAFGPDSDSAALIARAEQLAQQKPDEAAAIAAAAAVFVPNLAPRIAAAIASAVPAAAPAIAAAVAGVAPAAAPAIAAAVASAVPATAPQVAAAVAGAVPDQAPAVAGAVAGAVPDSAAQTAQAVAQTVPSAETNIANAVIAAVPNADPATINQAAQQGASQGQTGGGDGGGGGGGGIFLPSGGGGGGGGGSPAPTPRPSS